MLKELIKKAEDKEIQISIVKDNMCSVKEGSERWMELHEKWVALCSDLKYIIKEINSFTSLAFG